MNKIIIGVALVASLCGCTRNNFVDGCLFGEKLGDDLDWRRCALFVGDTGVAGLGVDESMVIIKRPLRPFEMSAQVEQYIACTNSSGNINALIYSAQCDDCSRSAKFVGQVEAIVKELEVLYGNRIIGSSKEGERDLAVVGEKFIIGLTTSKYMTFDTSRDSYGMNLYISVCDIEECADKAARNLASGAKGFREYWMKIKGEYPADYVKLIESKAAALSRKK